MRYFAKLSNGVTWGGVFESHEKAKEYFEYALRHDINQGNATIAKIIRQGE